MLAGEEPHCRVPPLPDGTSVSSIRQRRRRGGIRAFPVQRQWTAARRQGKASGTEKAPVCPLPREEEGRSREVQRMATGHACMKKTGVRPVTAGRTPVSQVPGVPFGRHGTKLRCGSWPWSVCGTGQPCGVQGMPCGVSVGLHPLQKIRHPLAAGAYLVLEIITSSKSCISPHSFSLW